MARPVDAVLAGPGGRASKPVDDVGWLCTAYVTDREALLSVLSQRAAGDDAGVSLPLTVATTAGVVPVVLSLLPAILHPLVYPAEDEDDDDATPDVQEATERARMDIELGDMRLERYSIIDARTRVISVDSERYLFVGDRLWVFSTEAAMTRAMLVHDGPALSDDPEYQRLTAKWQDGAALQAVALGRAWPLAEGGVSMEVVLDEAGLRFRYAGAFESETGVTDIGPALAQLPPGAVTVFAHGLGRAESFAREPLTAKGSDAARVPPLPVLAEAHGVAFGWYLQDGDHLWRRWLAVAPLDDELRRALRRAKTPPGRPGASRRHGALCYVERDGYLLVGECALVDEAAAGPPAPASSREQLRVAHAVRSGTEYAPGQGLGTEAAVDGGNRDLPGERLRPWIEGAACDVAHSAARGLGINGSASRNTGHAAQRDTVGGLADPNGGNTSAEREQRGGQQRQQQEDGGDCGLGAWNDIEWLQCSDGKARPAQPGVFPLAHGVSKGLVRGGDRSMAPDANQSAEGRVMRLRGYGNAIVPQVAAAFVTAFVSARECAA